MKCVEGDPYFHYNLFDIQLFSYSSFWEVAYSSSFNKCILIGLKYGNFFN